MAKELEEISTGHLLQKLLHENLAVPKDRVSFEDTDFDAPKDDNIYFVVKINSNPPHGQKNTYFEKEVENEQGEKEVKYFERQSMAVKEDITLSVISKSTTARTITPKVMLALMSTRSIQFQEEYGLHISRPYSKNSSFLESTARLNRFDIFFSIHRGYTNVMEVSYYDKFKFDDVLLNP